MTTRHDDLPSAHPTSSSSPPLSHAAQPRRRPALRHLLFSGGALLFFGILAYAIGGSSAGETEMIVGEKIRTIQLDVLNAAGEPKLAQRMTDFLRRRGFDVVEMGNYREKEIERTLVVDRGGNRQAALQVANALGIPEGRVVEQQDKTLYLDVSVIIGRDFKTLAPFRN